MNGIKTKLIKFLPIVLAVVIFAMLAMGCADASKQPDKKYEEVASNYVASLYVDDEQAPYNEPEGDEDETSPDVGAAQKSDDITIGTAAIYALIGFLVVVGVLALLVGVFYLSGFIFKTKALSREKLFEFKKKPTEPVYVPEIVDEGDELDVVAAITAAITAILTDENGGEKPEFVIRRVTRKNSK